MTSCALDFRPWNFDLNGLHGLRGGDAGRGHLSRMSLAQNKQLHTYDNTALGSGWHNGLKRNVSILATRMLPARTTAALALLEDAVQLGRVGLQVAEAAGAGDGAATGALGGGEGSGAVGCYKHALAVQLSHKQRDLRRFPPRPQFDLLGRR